MPILSGAANLNDTAADDILIGDPAGGANTTITGGFGNDLLWGDADHVLFVADFGNSSGTAYDLTGDLSLWSTAEDPDIADASTVPHATAVVESDGNEHWLAITVAAGARVTVDVDYGNHLLGTPTDAQIEIVDTGGVIVLASDDNTTFTQGAGGSTSTDDPYLGYTFAAAGTYFIRMTQSGGSPVPAGSTYVLNISLTGQAVTNLTPLRGDDLLSGGFDSDILFGGGGRDSLLGEEGIDTLHGGAGNDILDGGTFKDQSFGGSGDDIFAFSGNALGDDVYGGSGNDMLDLSAFDPGFFFTVDLVSGQARLFPNSGADWDYLLDSIENVTGSSGADTITGNSLNNRLSGGGGNDTIVGGGGTDFVDGGGGDDVLDGGLGNDIYLINSLGDLIQGEVAFGSGGGIDTVFTAIDFTLPTNVEILRAGAGIAGIDLTGNDAPGTLVGNEFANGLDGRGGNDQINGNAGNDTLTGGEGADTLVGGSGADEFVYNAVSNSRAGVGNRDVINGFDRGATQDIINLDPIDANTAVAGDQDFTFIGTGPFTAAGQVRVLGLGGPNACIVEINVNADLAADMQIFVNLQTTMVAGDFDL